MPDVTTRLRNLFRLGRPAAPVVPVIRLYGAIGAVGGPFRQGLHLGALAGTLQKAFSVPGAKAVALAINSPGGSPVQSSLIARRIRALAEEKKLPVYAFCEDAAASGGYWLACAADEIWADESSIVGSIGVIAAGFGLHEFIARHGIERRVYTAGESKSVLDPFQPENPRDVERIRDLQQDIHDAFIRHVRDRRGGRLKEGEAPLFDGSFWTGRRALQLGLVDGIGDLRQVMRERFGDKVRLRVVGEQRGWLRSRLRFTNDIAAGITDGVLGAAEERALWGRYGL